VRIKVEYGGSNIPKSLDYAGNKENNQSRLVWKQHLFHSDPEGIAQEMQMIQKSKPNVSKPLIFIKISPSPLDEIDDQLVKKICKEVCHEMGYRDSQAAVWEHNDSLVKHYHMICMTAGLTKKREVINEQYSGIHANKLSDSLEQRYSLVPAKDQENQYVKIISDVLLENDNATDIRNQLLRFGIEMKFDKKKKRFKYFRNKSNGASFGTGSFKQIDTNTLKRKLSYEQHHQLDQSSNKGDTRLSISRDSEVDQNNTKSRTSNIDKSEGSSIEF
jgi:hypothetical protein